MAYLLSRESEHELCSFWRFSGIIIRGPNRSEKDHQPRSWDERITWRRNPSQNAAFFTKSKHTKLSSPVSRVYARNAWVFTSLLSSFSQIQRTPGSSGMLFTAVTKFQGKLASLHQVSSAKSQDNFQIYCADMYLVRFLANFAGFRVFLCISRDFADLLEIHGSATARNIRCPVQYTWTLLQWL